MKSQGDNVANSVVAMMLAWIIPGAGHIFLGRWVRGVIIFITIGATFWSGVALGGVLTVDHRNARWWFVAQMLTGVHGLVGFYDQKQVYQTLPAVSNDAELDAMLQEKGIALADNPTDSIARAYTGVAGMLNVLCIMDALLLGLMGVQGEGKRSVGDKPTEDIEPLEPPGTAAQAPPIQLPAAPDGAPPEGLT